MGRRRSPDVLTLETVVRFDPRLARLSGGGRSGGCRTGLARRWSAVVRTFSRLSRLAQPRAGSTAVRAAFGGRGGGAGSPGYAATGIEPKSLKAILAPAARRAWPHRWFARLFLFQARGDRRARAVLDPSPA